jgi:hypothetical protein
VIRLRYGDVTGVRGRWAGAVELDVVVDGSAGRALAYPELVGEPAAGDRVLLNTTAVALGLGTGGYHLVVAIPASTRRTRRTAPRWPTRRRCQLCRW